MPNSRPFQVALISDGTSLCGGSIITPWRILTAAHCPDGRSTSQVIAGAHDRTVNEPTQQRATIPAEFFLIHENYSDNNFDNDIAILLLSRRFEINEFVSVISLPDPVLGDFTGMTGRVSGWGRVESGSSVPRLRFVDLPIISTQACTASWPRVNDIHLCAGTTGGRASCQGDSGGPLTVMTGGRIFVVGIVSFGTADCLSGVPDVYVRVSTFNQWLRARF